MPIFSRNVRTLSDVDLTAWAQVSVDHVVVAEMCFQVTEEEAEAAGYWFHKKGLAMEQAHRWGEEMIKHLQENTYEKAMGWR